MAATPWNDNFRDSTENTLVVSSGDLLAENNEEFDDAQPWYDDIIDRVGPPGRAGDYFILEVGGGPPTGPDVLGSSACAWSHAFYGDEDTQLWNGSTTDPDDMSSPVCRVLGPGLLADPALNTPTPAYVLDYEPTDLIVAASMRGQFSMAARGIWLRHAKNNLDLRGVLSFALADPLADGVPADKVDEAEFEWEPGQELELIKVEVTGDIAGRPATGTVLDGMRFILNDEILPGYTDGVGWASQWAKGDPNNAPDATGREHRSFTYYDGDPSWLHLDEFTSWADVADVDNTPDISVGLLVDQMTTPTVDTGGTNGSDIAVRLTFRSPRYRWVWAGANPVIRQYPRDDGRGISSAPRLYPPTKAGRLAGGYQ